jgi:hypothetical protein
VMSPAFSTRPASARTAGAFGATTPGGNDGGGGGEAAVVELTPLAVLWLEPPQPAAKMTRRPAITVQGALRTSRSSQWRGPRVNASHRCRAPTLRRSPTIRDTTGVQPDNSGVVIAHRHGNQAGNRRRAQQALLATNESQSLGVAGPPACATSERPTDGRAHARVGRGRAVSGRAAPKPSFPWRSSRDRLVGLGACAASRSGTDAPPFGPLARRGQAHMALDVIVAVSRRGHDLS